MSLIRTYTCEVCGAAKRSDSDGWYMVAENRWHDTLEILVCDDPLAAQDGMMHLCGGSHLQRWVSEWMEPTRTEYPQATHLPSPQLLPEEKADPERRAALQIGQIKLDRSMLTSGIGDDRETMLAMLDAIEGVLHDHGSELVQQAEEEEVLVFDA